MIFLRFIKYWLPLLLWVAAMFIGSTDLMSAEHTSRFLVPFLHWLKGDISAETVAQVQLLMRKGAHLAEYAIFAILFWRTLYRGTKLKMNMPIVYVSVWIAAALLAAADEFHQSFVVSRTASPNDVLIDICGTLIGLVICSMFARKREPWA